MRNAVLIAVVAVVSVAGILAFLHFHAPKAVNPSAPGQHPVSNIRKPQILIDRRFGAWQLLCTKRHVLTPAERAAINPMGGNLSNVSKSLFCKLQTRLFYPNNKARSIDLTYRRVGSGKFYNINLKLAPNFWSSGDYFELHLDGTVHKIKVVLCAPLGCAAVPVRKPDEIAQMKMTAGEQMVSAKSASFAFPAAGNQPPVELSIPLAGFREAVAVMAKADPDPVPAK